MKFWKRTTMNNRPCPLISVLLLLLTGGLLFPAGSGAKTHALLMGVSTYEHPDLVPSLEGPKYDLKAMEAVLRKQGVDNIWVLQDKAAGKTGILEGIRNLFHTTESGDNIIIYFSGHGTSRAAGAGLPLPHTSGAVIPYDFYRNETDSSDVIMSRLVVGRSDLRPLFSELSRDRKLLIIFDACFSGNTVRSLDRLIPGKPRYTDLGDIFDDDLGGFGKDTIQNQPFYRNTFYISASSEFEKAGDIDRETIQATGIRTYNMEPHGVLTDAVLKVLSGRRNADLNNDNAITMEELHQAVTRIVKTQFSQTPHALPARDDENTRQMRSASFFRASPPDNDAVYEVQERSVNVQVDSRFPQVRQLISRATDIHLTETTPDLRIINHDGRPAMTFANHRQICIFQDEKPDIIVARLRQYAKVVPLIRLGYPRQKSNVFLRIKGESPKTLYHPGEKIGLRIQSSGTSHILVINIESRGRVNVLYPYFKEELGPLDSRTPLEFDDMEITAPPGAEVIKVFSFSFKPRELESLMGKEDILPGTRAYTMLSKLVFENAGQRTDIAQDTLEFTSYTKTEFKK